MAKTRPADSEAIRGRRAKAHQFMQAAADTAGSDTTDAYITMLVHAGIAAADVLCGQALGHYSTSENHADAVKMLKTVNKAAANHLQTLISIKSKSAYTPLASSGTDRTKAERAAQHLMASLT